MSSDCHFENESLKKKKENESLFSHSVCCLRPSSHSPPLSPNKAVSPGLCSPLPWLGLAPSTSSVALEKNERIDLSSGWWRGAGKGMCLGTRSKAPQHVWETQLSQWA